MSFIQFLRILMARRWIILGTLVGCTVLALAVASRLPERYPAKTRVMLDVIKPDPVTGAVIATQFVRGYTRTQIELIQDYRVAGDVVDRRGDATKPSVIAMWQDETGGAIDIRRWLAERIIKHTDANLVEGSNILEISYEAPNPEVARSVVGMIRDAYIDASLRFRTDSAGRTADWYRQQADKAQLALVAAETAKSNFERANGLVMGAGGVDAETTKLQGLQAALLTARGAAGQQEVSALQTADTSGMVSNLKMQLATAEDQLQQAGERLGTSHPTYQALVQRRQLLQRQLATETAAARSSGGGGAAASRRSIAELDAEYRAQKALVLGMKDKLDQLGALQREVELRRSQYEKAAARTADLKLEADVNETGLVPLGDPVGTGTPSFPNMPLIATMAVAGGLVLGLILAIGVELLGRRVRGSEDLAAAARVPVLAVIAGNRPSPIREWFRRRLSRNSDVGMVPAQ
ncbi:exopolysaccharide biosynthesis protein EpsF [Glacieibacterium frigidum]|uniref:Exopolysaccharide biosynthesis protein EpsF n=1 Tax=Glacieibacterium frigidum TaxID=2593303 RepID=A0A552UIB2_9SPHN|nr:exopolysaccharide biosynthesis protein EpsF [Glacieibacterium frigidum]TRW17962.1 exopolysaccharide biosynthesis protein EpsF [Glacieibacterium frigidum]